MSANNPIIPPGSPLQRSRPERNSKLILAVFVILAAHVMLLSGLLIQGCKREDKAAMGPQDTLTNTLPPISSAPASASLPPSDQNRPLPPLDSTPAPAPLTPPVVVTDAAPTSAVAATPQLNSPTRVEPSPKAHRSTLPADTVLVPYTVKVGDTLTKLARIHSTTVPAIRQANNLKTDRILTGQKLKIPQNTVSGKTNETKTAVNPVRSSPE